MLSIAVPMIYEYYEELNIAGYILGDYLIVADTPDVHYKYSYHLTS